MGIPNEEGYAHFITWDYHSSSINPIVFLSLSKDNECFVWKELNIDPKQNTTLVFAQRIAEESEGKRYTLCTIDPLAGENQTTTNTSVLDDVNKYLRALEKRGECQRIRFEPYDTKYHATAKGFLQGRDHIKQRLNNSKTVKVPRNNTIVDKGITKKLQTIWVFSNCQQVSSSLSRWRVGSNGKPEQKWSHHCTALEGIVKDKRFKPKVEMFTSDLKRKRQRRQQENTYFRSR